MKIDKIKFTNFTSWSNQTIRFSNGLNVLSGRSGSGKTNILRGIGLGVFNHSSVRIADLLTFGLASGAVQTWLASGEQTIRGLPGSSWELLDSSGRVISDKVGSTTEALSARFGLAVGLTPADLWQSIIWVDQLEIITDMASGDSTRRKRQWEKVLGVERYDKTYRELREVERLFQDRVAGIKTELAALLVRTDELPGLQARIEATKAQITSLQCELDLLTTELQQKNDNRLEAEKAISTLKAEIEQQSKRFHAETRVEFEQIKIEGERRSLLKQVADLMAEVGALELEADKLASIDLSVFDHVDELRDEALGDLTKLSVQIEQETKLLAIRKEDRCPTCGQPQRYSQSELSEFECEIKERSKERVDKRRRVDELNMIVVEKNRTVNDLVLAQSARSKLPTLNYKLSDLRTALNEKEAALAALPAVNPHQTLKQVEELKLDLKQREDALADVGPLAVNATRVKTELELRLANLAADEAKQAELLKAREDVLMATSDLFDTQKDREHTSEIRHMSRQMGSLITERLLAQVAIEANRFFSEAWLHRSGRLRIDPDYRVIVRLDGWERDFGLCSRGQQVTVALSIRLALARLFHVPLLVLDEATIGALDDETRRIIPGWIAGLTDMQIIVVDHSGLFDIVAANIIKIENRNGRSYVT